MLAYIVVPLSAANPGSRNLVWVLLSIAVHAFLIGTPCALFARRAMQAARATGESPHGETVPYEKRLDV